MTESMVLKTLSGMETNSRVKEELTKVRKQISEMANRVTVTFDDEPVSINVTNDWYELAPSVSIIECSLNDASDCTILNVQFREGGVIKKHRHSRQEDIFVVSGSLHDYVNGIEIPEGTVYSIPPNKPHGFKSNNAKLTVVFRPPYPKVKIGNA